MFKKRFFGLMSSLLIISFSLSGCATNAEKTLPLSKTTTTSSPVSQIYAFGDSYSDNGESMRISKEVMKLSTPIAGASILPCDPKSKLYWNGRWSDGPTAVENLASDLKVKLTDFAVGGAKSGTDSYYDWLNQYQKTGVLGQIDSFKGKLAGAKADSKALYFIFVSANDFFYHMDYTTPGTIDELSGQTVQNIKTAVKELSALGAKKFMVVNSTDLTAVPWVVANAQTNEAKEFTTNVNTELPGVVKSLGTSLNIKIVLFDHTAVSKQIRSNPAKYGLKEINKSFEKTYPDVIAGKGDPDQYYFWDEWHPTRIVHKIVGAEMAKEVRNIK